MKRAPALATQRTPSALSTASHCIRHCSGINSSAELGDHAVSGRVFSAIDGINVISLVRGFGKALLGKGVVVVFLQLRSATREAARGFDSFPSRWNLLFLLLLHGGDSNV